jgi:hypothetical protein
VKARRLGIGRPAPAPKPTFLLFSPRDADVWRSYLVAGIRSGAGPVDCTPKFLVSTLPGLDTNMDIYNRQRE